MTGRVASAGADRLHVCRPGSIVRLPDAVPHEPPNPSIAKAKAKAKLINYLPEDTRTFYLREVKVCDHKPKNNRELASWLLGSRILRLPGSHAQASVTQL